MAGTDWLLYGSSLAILVGGAYQFLRIVRFGQEFPITGEVVVGRGGTAGFQAMFLPAAVGMFFMVVGLMLLEFQDSGPIYVAGIAAIWLFLFCFVLAGSLFLFMRPRFLVLPVLRGQPGWVVGTYRSLRALTRRGPRGKRSR